DLASGDPGSGVNGGAATAEDEDENALTVTFTGPDTYSVDISGLADGPHTVSNTVPDLAMDANDLTFDISFNLDDTAPTFGALDPAPVGSAGTDANAIVITIGGTINDANIIDSAVLSIWNNVAGVCNDGDDVKLAVGSDPNESDVNDVDLTDGTGAISFNQSFTVQQPSAAAVTVNYCFLIVAEDEAVLKDGTDTGNSNSLTSIVAVTWNAG
ncbi:MAG: hypothetical protein MJB57_07320, partial [Gemmatimonadetes bacterium]|nr:hypothetical protein [Gemmatimonadota bacterium]